MLHVILLLVSASVLVLLYCKYAFGYWKRKNVPYVEPTIPFGKLRNPITRKQGLHNDLAEVYFTLRARGFKHGGFYTMTFPVYMPIDIYYVKNILTKDFHHFVNHGIYCNEKDDPLSANLFAIEDEKWKNLRAKITPTFTSGKMKMMMQTLKDCSVPLIQEIDTLSRNKQALDIKELVARFSTDVIGSCAFGIDCNSFNDPDAEFRKYGKRAFEVDFVSKIKVFILITLPKIARAIKMAFIFFLAGFETSSTTMTFCFYELAKNQDIQEILRKEINSVLAKYNGEITYDAIQEMKYLGQVIDETLRKYPPATILNRVCNKAYQVPGTDVVIEMRTTTLIPTYTIQHDPQYYPDPEKFDPDRFSYENKHKLVPFTFLPFGEGPRICIGLRFGLVQTKIGLVTILKKFRLTLNKATPKEMKADPNTFVLSFKDTLYLDSEII